MRIHMHTLCWNDAAMLPHFFRHYDPWVDQYYFFDDGSTDGSREYLEARANVEVQTTPHADPDSWVLSAREIYNKDWRRSIGKADWVIITNVDEHLFHPRMKDYLQAMLALDVTLVPAPGYQMVADEYPTGDDLLCEVARMGAPSPAYSRLAIFRPDRLTEINYGVGRHRAQPQGSIKIPPRDEVINLHYKYVGREETHVRHAEQALRLGQTDVARNYGFQYRWDKAQLDEHFDKLKAAAVDATAITEHVPEICYWRR
jgi:hypothetical protein